MIYLKLQPRKLRRANGALPFTDDVSERPGRKPRSAEVELAGMFC
jgi:hypothetical protein